MAKKKGVIKGTEENLTKNFLFCMQPEMFQEIRKLADRRNVSIALWIRRVINRELLKEKQYE